MRCLADPRETIVKRHKCWQDTWAEIDTLVRVCLEPLEEPREQVLPESRIRALALEYSAEARDHGRESDILCDRSERFGRRCTQRSLGVGKHLGDRCSKGARMRLKERIHALGER